VGQVFTSGIHRIADVLADRSQHGLTRLGAIDDCVELEPVPTSPILGRAVEVEFSGAVETVGGRTFDRCVNASILGGDQGLGFIRDGARSRIAKAAGLTSA
jgi:hypothetical protein